jgi:Zn-dependent protease with chaperone function
MGMTTKQPAGKSGFAADLVRFPGISYKAFAYEGDETALETLKAVPGFGMVAQWLIDNLYEEYVHLDQLYNCCRVNEQNYPSIYGVMRTACEILDAPVPEVFIRYSPVYNACTSGVDRVFVELNSALVDDYDEQELLVIVGHEMGHVKANHVKYKMVADFIVKFLPILSQIVPFNLNVLIQPLLLALFEWSRRAELTCDRAGLLCAQHPATALGALSKFSGRVNKYPTEFSQIVLNAQAAEVAESKHKIVRLLLFLDNMQRTHPYSAYRAKMLKDWVDGGNFQKILGGDYEKDVLGEHQAGDREPCPGCGKRILVTLEFCPHCGTKQARGGEAAASGRVCAGCGAPLAPKANFCVKCGAKVG